MPALGLDIGGTRVKVALLGDDGRVLATRAGEPYRNPTAAELIRQVHTVTAAVRAGDTQMRTAIGISVPGVVDEQRRRVVYAANVPGLEGLDLADIARAAGGEAWTLATDQIAAATDYAGARSFVGRLLAVSIGTGVGCAVLDCDAADPLGRPVRVNGDSPGHLGQIDVSLDEHPPVGPDGGAGSLEAYLGAAALARRDPSSLEAEDLAVRALARALRIAHAIYRPHEIALLGGIGIRLSHLAGPLYAQVNDRLTRLARPRWRLGFGVDDFHAARGAARLAAGEAGHR